MNKYMDGLKMVYMRITLSFLNNAYAIISMHLCHDGGTVRCIDIVTFKMLLDSFIDSQQSGVYTATPFTNWTFLHDCLGHVGARNDAAEWLATTQHPLIVRSGSRDSNCGSKTFYRKKSIHISRSPANFARSLGRNQAGERSMMTQPLTMGKHSDIVTHNITTHSRIPTILDIKMIDHEKK